MTRSVISEIFVGFIGNDEQVVTQRNFSDLLQHRFPEYRSSGVDRRVDNHCLGAAGNGPFQHRSIEFPIVVFHEGNKDRNPSRHSDLFKVGRVSGNRNQDFISRLDDGQDTE